MESIDNLSALQEDWVVIYAKIVIDKDSGIYLNNVYFGGYAESLSGAECAARSCINNIKGGTIIPKKYKLSPEIDLIEAFFDATQKFESMVSDMQKVESITSRNKAKKK